ncbi:hypothetical protein RB199_12125 [Streptomyces libani]
MLTSHRNTSQGSPTALLDAVDHSVPTAPADDPRSGGHVLVVGAPGPRRERLTRTLRATGHEVSHAPPGDVDRRMAQAQPDAIVALDDRGAPGAHDDRGPDVIREVRTAPAGRALPLLMVTDGPGPSGVADMLRRGADDCVPEASDPVELSARIEAKLRRVPVPVENLPRDPRTGLYSHAHFLDELDRELQRPEAARNGGVLAVVRVAEMAALEARLGQRIRREVAERLAGVAERLGSFCDRLGWDDDGHLLMLLPGVDEETARRGLEKFAATVAGTRFIVADENVRLTPAIGWLPLAGCTDGDRATGQGPGRGPRGAAPPGSAPGPVRALDARHTAPPPAPVVERADPPRPFGALPGAGAAARRRGAVRALPADVRAGLGPRLRHVLGGGGRAGAVRAADRPGVPLLPRRGRPARVTRCAVPAGQRRHRRVSAQ